ncbi:Insect cuticle protein,Chitin-binding type R&R consensus [Cinara cedri]|uniref:Insect cuticle protein,Chitin-binding type R&R consensus n=1 Tax=Cinara cedri TaxID=506608 RepID=A0A5E4MUG9_9HEMI|nr:Insect cuticle protein,Chitin-binding type R&R consensus [Cinara cedri]
MDNPLHSFLSGRTPAKRELFTVAYCHVPVFRVFCVRRRRPLEITTADNIIIMIAQYLLVAAVAAVAMSVSVTQDEYARYIAQQQEKQPEKGQLVRRPVLVQVVQSAAGGAYPQPTPAASSARPAYQQAAAYQPLQASPAPAYQTLQASAYQPQPAKYQVSSYPQPAYQPPPQQAYQPQEQEYEQPEPQYQPPVRASQGPRPKAPSKPKASNRPEKPEDEENDNNPNAQYQFSFDISDDESTNYHNRKEQRDGEKISGSYSVVDSDGFIRTVTYTADPEEGFKAEVSREPTNIQVKIPTPAPQTPAPASQYRLPERKAQPQYITLPQADEQESAAPVDPISGYYQQLPQQQQQPAKAPSHRFAASRPQQAGSKAAALGYATAPTHPPVLYQAYQQ